MTAESHSNVGNKVLIRPARLEDTPRVIALTSTIWDGHDYVPREWPAWLEDPHGRLVVAELEGQVVGLVRLARIREGEWWLQGLRVDPAYEGRGIASRLHDDIVAYGDENLNGVVRLATFRPQVYHLCQRTGFRVVGKYSEFRAPVQAAGDLELRPAGPNDLHRVAQRLSAGHALPDYARLIDSGWTWITPGIDHLQRCLAEGRLWAGEQGEILAVRPDEEDGVQALYLEWLLCPPERLGFALHQFRRLGFHTGQPGVFWAAPLDPGIQAVMEAVGFTRSWDGFVWLFERYFGRETREKKPPVV
jgi:GNAT superfamily N-acetyltransferase